ncbi:hypothetical protein Mycch_2665 [Mycolicibacterium chubuense NBB4]|uniref:Uncharacterized protein n=1 Tax=Mycolicibacterium chubuense (strain NBB4) TaxID=710421 RepID=I4BJH5_MYCCN|nr:hypothetical protein [Mycolicibacterium chubuense]AFM17432.1 hypothetical protein Mycch_2665 [Mycolicibacterium chubuense NBB4]
MNDIKPSNAAPTRFLRVETPGRCGTCSWHVETQGHHPQCTGGQVKPVAPPLFLKPGEYLLPWDDDDTIRRHQQLWEILRPVKPPGPQRVKSEPWFDATFDGVIEDVRKIQTRRNSRLFWAARRLGELAHYGHWDESECERALMDASAHWDDCEYWRRRSLATIKSGWKTGTSEPKDAGAK